MRKLLAVATVLAVLVLLSSATARAGDDKIQLAFHLEKGQSYKLVMTTDQEIVQQVPGRGEMKVQQTTSIGYTFAVTDVDDKGTATIDVTFGPVSMKVDTGMGTFEYDSEDAPDEIPASAQNMAALVGKSFTMKLATDGETLEVTGVDELLDELLELIDLPEGPIKQRMTEDVKKQFGEAGLKESMGNMIGIFPDEPVGIGDSWARIVTITAGFPIIVETTYTLAGRDDGVATIEIEATMKPNPDAEPISMGPMTMRYELEGTQEGTLKIDEATGWYVEGTMDQDLKGQLVMSGIPGQEGELPIPMTIKSTITFKTE